MGEAQWLAGSGGPPVFGVSITQRPARDITPPQRTLLTSGYHKQKFNPKQRDKGWGVTMRFSAFISYNHRDRDWAVWLHRALERYRVPKRLWGRPSPWGPLEARLPPVFRDRDELATSTDLAASVREALAQSATLIVICSPNSAKSKWVNEEIRTFVESGRGAFVRLIIVDGEPHSLDAERECLPPYLARDGAPEPLAADVRKEGDGRDGARLKIIAGLLGVSYDELRQREAARRQKRLAAIATAALVGLVVMSGLTTFALISRGEAVEQRRLADRRTITAERTVEFVKGMFQYADPSEARGESITAREIVDRGAEQLNTRSLANEPGVRAELGVTLAEVYGALGLYRKGDALIRDTLSIRHGERRTRARQLKALGESQFRLGNYQASLATFRRALAESGGRGDVLQAGILVGLGQALSSLEQSAEADRVLRQALRIDRARGEEAGNDVARDLEAIGLNHLADGELDKARPYFLRALPLRRQFEGPLSPSVSDNYNALGSIAYARHDLPTAERYFRGNLAVDRKVLGPDHPDVATTINNLARVLIEQRRHGQAKPLLQQALTIARKERGDAHPDMAFVFANLAIASRHTGQLREAETLFEQAIAAARQNEHRILGPSLADLAEIQCSTGRAGDGLKLLDEAARVTAADYPDQQWRLAWVENIRGECLIRQGQSREGAERIARSTKVILRTWPRGTLFADDAERRLLWSRNLGRR